MSKRSHQRQTVYVVIPPEDFRPISPWTWPDEFTSGKLLAKNILAGEARTMALAFNDRQMQLGRPIRQWALAGRYLRRGHNGSRTAPAAA